MVTKTKCIEGYVHAILPNGDLRKVITCYGKSTDVKPVDGMFNCDMFYEMDTQKVSMFDEDTRTWLEQ